MLIPCPQCGGKVAENASACPTCGAPVQNGPAVARELLKNEFRGLTDESARLRTFVIGASILTVMAALAFLFWRETRVVASIIFIIGLCAAIGSWTKRQKVTDRLRLGDWPRD